MKDRIDAIVRSQQALYLERLLKPRDPLLREMEVKAAEDDVPISDPEVGLLLQILVRSIGAKRVLEVGAAIGYGTIWITRGNGEVVVSAVERNPERIAEGRAFVDREGASARVEWLEGEALDLMPTLTAPFDLIYIDVDKASYRRCLDAGLQLLRVGGLVVIDNLLWKGQVADPPEDFDNEDDQAEILRRFNNYFAIHPQLDSLVLPFGDGVGLGVKTQPLITELGGPF